MANFGSPVAGNNPSPNGMQSLSDIMNLQRNQQALQSGALGIQQQQQNLQTGVYSQQSAQSDAQLKQQQMAERQNLQQMMHSGKDDQGNNIRDQNGNPDLATILPALGRMNPLTGQQTAQELLKTATAKIGLQAAATTLDSQQRAALMGPIQAIATNPNDPNMVGNASNALDSWVTQHPEMAGMVNNAKHLLDYVRQAPDADSRAASANSLAALFQPGQPVQTQPQATNLDVGGKNLQGRTAPPVAGGGFHPTTSQDFTTKPQVITNTLGQPQVMPGGQGAASASGGSGLDISKLSPQELYALAQSDPEAFSNSKFTNTSATQNNQQWPSTIDKTLFESNAANVVKNREDAKNAQINLNILNQIKQGASTPGLYLGPGSQYVANLATVAAQLPGMEGAAKYANNYNELVKYMAQNATMRGNQAGLSGSDARLDAAVHMNPNANPSDARTAQNVAEYFSGIERMGLAKANAQDNWLNQPGNSTQNANNFESLWRNNADPRLFQIGEMQDPNAAKAYIQKHINQSEIPTLQKKRQMLVNLGALPPSAADQP